MTYMYPFPPGTRKSQPFGANPNNGVNGPGGHTGDDWAVDVGTPVRAAADGVIELSSWVSANYQENPWWLTQMGGDCLVLNAGSAKPTFVYAHLSDSLIDVGQHVYKGQIIGYSGNTGTATTGPHTHVEVLPPGYVLNSDTYGRINPELVFDEYYTGTTIQPESVTTVQEDDMSAEDVAAIRGDLNTVNMAIIGAEKRIRADINTVHQRVIAEAASQRETITQLAGGDAIDYTKIDEAIADALANGLNFTLTAKDHS